MGNPTFEKVFALAQRMWAGMIEAGNRNEVLPVALVGITPQGFTVIKPEGNPAVPSLEEWLALWPGHTDEERAALGVRQIHESVTPGDLNKQ